MELRELRALIALAEHLHFGKAATALHLSQPALTKQLQRMEMEVGGALVLRQGRQTQLTPAGLSLANDARKLLAELPAMIHRAHRIAKGQEGRLRIGFGMATRQILPAVITAFRARCPAIEVSLADMSSAAQFQALAQGELDIGFVRLPAPAHCQTLAVVEEELVLVYPAQAGWQGWKPSTPALPRLALRAERAPHHSKQVESLLSSKGCFDAPVQSLEDFDTLLTLVASGGGYAIVPKSGLGAHAERIGVHALDDPKARWRIGAAWIAEQESPARAAFLGCLRQVLGEQTGDGIGDEERAEEGEG